MNRLLLVSNRLPVTLVQGPDGIHVERSVGGLAAGLREPHEQSGGLWIGWPGPLEPDSPEIRKQLNPRFAALGIVPVYLSEREVRRYYETFANGVLWPLFHYLTGQVPLRVEGWDDYVAANKRFAAVVIENYRPGDLVWVHDYQLMLLPSLLRRALPDARIGFFLHIPFPTSELFATLPNRDELLEGLLGADLIGFHTASYLRHFASTLVRLLKLEVVNDTVQCEGRRVRLGVFPMGVDARAIEQRSQQPDVMSSAAELRTDPSVKLLVGIDRLDYTKGIPRRLLSFKEMLSHRPDWHEKVRLIQVAVPSRTGVRSYRKFRDEVDALVGNINGTFGTPHWTPLHYIYRSVPEDQLLGLYRAADVMLVTPVRDGMNLVTKEFVAVRDDEDGVLVLSEFAGAAEKMQQALMVNPYDLEGTAEAYHRALTLSRSERRERMRALRARVFTHDVHEWVASFLNELGSNHNPRLPMEGWPPNALRAWPAIAARLNGKRPIVFLDYDGTLSPIAARPEQALLAPGLRALLRRLATLLPVAIVSGRGLDDLTSKVGLNGIIYAASHGFDIAGPGQLRHQVAADCVPVLQHAAEQLRQRTQDVAGALIEEKRFSVAAHYRMVSRIDAPRIMDAVDEVLQEHEGLEKHYGDKVIELRPAVAWDKGTAVLWILNALGYDDNTVLPIFLGDDLTDEDAFAAIAERGLPIVTALTPRPTRAHHSLRGVPEVKLILECIEGRVRTD